MNKDEIDRCLAGLDGTGSDSESEAFDKLKVLGIDLVPLLITKYNNARKWKERSACVYYATKYSRESDQSVSLGILALSDRSAHVRYLSCQLLAWSLCEEAIQPLKEKLALEPSDEDRGYLEGAIDAITHKNSNFFVDREHSGMVFLNVL